jgi:hypothetical protein
MQTDGRTSTLAVLAALGWWEEGTLVGGCKGPPFREPERPAHPLSKRQPPRALTRA